MTLSRSFPGSINRACGAFVRRRSPATARAKAKFVLATDGETFEGGLGELRAGQGHEQRAEVARNAARDPIVILDLNAFLPNHSQIFMIALGNTLFPQSACQI